MKLKYITWIPAVVMMIIIFYFSAKPADNSNESSMTIANRVLTVYENITDKIYQGEARTSVLENINHVVRKGAHFSEYMLLAVLIALHFLVLGKRGKQLLFFPALISSLYAATDELHQLFVPGRSCMFTDVLIDSSGALTGAILFTLLFLLRLRCRQKKKKSELIQE